jgi:RNA polymerase sigma-70 factor, ECF subfamily
MFRGKEKKKRKEFEKIYDDHVEKIFRFVYLKVNSKDDAEDITSRVFIKTWSSYSTSNKNSADLKNPKAFLYKVARNMVIDHYRKNKGSFSEEDSRKEVSLESVIVPDKEMRPDERALLDSEIKEVKKALSLINEDYQNIIILYYLNELTASEIADLLDKPESSIRVLIHRAVSALRKELKGKKKKV